MIPLLWAAIASGSGLAWLTVESIVRGDGGGGSLGTTALWLIIGPIVVVGAMVHQRRSTEQFSYGKAFTTGFVTSLAAAAGLLLVWLFYVLVLNTEFFTETLTSVAIESRNAGDSEQVVQIRVGAAALMFSSPVFFLISFFIPLFAGTVAALIAAVGVKRKSG